MNAARPRLRRQSHVFLTLALMALVMRVLMPAGFMMGEGRTGAYTIVICSPEGSHTETIDLPAGGKKDTGRTEKHDAPCVFAGHGLADAPAQLMLPAPDLLVRAVPVAATVRDVAPGRGLAAPPPPPTGPPALLI